MLLKDQFRMKIENIYRNTITKKITVNSDVKSKFINDFRTVISGDKFSQRLWFIDELERLIPTKIKIDIWKLISDSADLDLDLDLEGGDECDMITLLATCLMLDCENTCDLGDDKFSDNFNCYIVSLDDDFRAFSFYGETEFVEWAQLYERQELEKTGYAEYEKESVNDPGFMFLSQQVDGVFSKGDNGLWDGETILVRSDFINNLPH